MCGILRWGLATGWEKWISRGVGGLEASKWRDVGLKGLSGDGGKVVGG